LNSIVAFTVAFFVIASSQLVRIVSEIIANTMILVVTGVCFMLAIGVTHTGQDEFKLEGGWLKSFYWFGGLGVLFIFLNALGWLNAIYDFLVRNWNSAHVATILMILVFVGFMVWVTWPTSIVKTGGDSKKS
jgi:uncharacterized membrane protein YdcZ (DUF606 family)